MALVNYSDSESDAEAEPVVPKPQPAKATSHKIVDRSATGKIRVNLPDLKPEADQDDNERSAKRKKVGGAFSGFNSLLPPPKRRVQSALEPGVSLKTSGEAAFDRSPLDANEVTNSSRPSATDDSTESKPAEVSVTTTQPKLVGKVTRFVPLSVANRKKKQQNKATPTESKGTEVGHTINQIKDEKSVGSVVSDAPQTRQEPKRSLFLASQEKEEEEVPSVPDHKTGDYEPLLERRDTVNAINDYQAGTGHSAPVSIAQPNALENMATDLNLTASQKRQLFGRKAKDVDIAHFNMEAEYAANEELRRAGETVQHRAVKAIAPGKHSLQQLVSNAKSQKDAMEDAWAEGRKNRGEGGSKYGWG